MGTVINPFIAQLRKEAPASIGIKLNNNVDTVIEKAKAR